MQRLSLGTAISAAVFVLAVPSAQAGASANQDEARFSALFAGWHEMKPHPRRSPPKVAARERGAARARGNEPVAVNSNFGMRTNPVLGRQMFHMGADLAARTGRAIYATADGAVVRSGWAGSYGLLVTLRHAGGYETRYAHMSRVMVIPGQWVGKGQIIGLVGSTGRSTGAHLHYEVRRNGQALNPLSYFRK